MPEAGTVADLWPEGGLKNKFISGQISSCGNWNMGYKRDHRWRTVGGSL